MTLCPELHINLAAAAANYRRMAALAAPAECAAVVKADAYGIGAKQLAPVLFKAGCRTFFVATLEEAITLRPLIPDATLSVLQGLWEKEVPLHIAHGIVPVISNLEQLGHWQRAAKASGTKLPLFLNCDTGMNRLGMTPREVDTLADDLARLDGLDLRFVMSHLACPERPEHPLNEEQRTRFEAIKKKLPPARYSLSNSSGLFLGAGYRQDMLRTGAGLYGINPQPGQPSPVECVATLTAPIIAWHEVPDTHTVGYGAIFTATPGMRLAVVAAGYADGYMRACGNGNTAFFAGHHLPIAGRVSMDMVTLDATAVPPEKLRAGAMVELIGPNCPIDQIAKNANTIGYEIFTRLGSRLKRE
ncbi:MAG: alanine racemase [Alphaproteobacteria bacterium]|nr:alanine racemase [Alphaproteobacteria bacterium]